MKTLLVITLAAGTLCCVHEVSAQTGGTGGGAGVAPSNTKNAGTPCAACAQRAPAAAVSTQPVPGTNEAMLVGRIENLMPIGVVAVLGCEPCAAKTVAWALQQGSSTDDVERALRTIAAMQQLDCFKQQFGPDAAARLEKPLAAARKALQEAIDRAGK